MGRMSPHESSMLMPQEANFCAISFFSTMSRLSNGAFGISDLILSMLYMRPVVPHIQGMAWRLPGSTRPRAAASPATGSALRAFGMAARSSVRQKPCGISRAELGVRDAFIVTMS